MSSSPPDTSPAGVVAAEAVLQNPATLSDLFAVRSYVWFWIGAVSNRLSIQVQAIALAWQVYAVARQTSSVAQASLAVGLLGLAQFLPMFALTLFAGHSADIYDRRKIMMAGLAVQLCTSALFAAMAYGGLNLLWPIYGVAALFGCARAFYTPSSAALAPTLVERRLIPRAIVVNSAGNQMATIVGPAIGGLLVAFSPVAAFLVSGALCLASLVSLLLVKSPPRQPRPTASRWALIAEGLNYVWTTKVVLGAISLDLFAVLLGGVTALLPVYARDILHVGPEGFGILRAAPSAGAILTGFVLAARPLKTRVGLKMFAAVGIYGLSTLVFALSRSMALERRGARHSGRGRHGLGLRAPDARADRDPRRHARPRLRRVEPVHRRLQRTGRIRIRRHGAPARARRLGDFRRLRRDCRDAAVGGDFSGAAEGGQAGVGAAGPHPCHSRFRRGLA